MKNVNCFLCIKRVILLFFAVVLLPSAVDGSFSVTPMRVELSARPGTREDVRLRINNTSARTLDLGFKVVDVEQTETGGWRVYDEHFRQEERPFYSCVEWISLSDDLISLFSMRRGDVSVRIDVPRDARGVYFAAVVAEPPLPESDTGFAVRMRYLIPIIVHIEGRAVRQNIELGEWEMNWDPGGRRHPPATIIQMNVSNEGRSYSRVSGQLSVEYQKNNSWLPVQRVKLEERAVMPGFSFPLVQRVERALPSGTYRLRGELYVDGRRLPPVSKEIEFEGDPSVDTLSPAVPIVVDSEELSFELQPGRARVKYITVENTSEHTVRVNAVVSAPDELLAAEFGDMAGESFSAAGFVSAQPKDFTLLPGREQNLRIFTRMTDSIGPHALYYAMLHLSSPDETFSSAVEAPITVRNTEVNREPEVVLLNLGLVRGEGAEFIFHPYFANTGNAHLNPRISAEIMDENGKFVGRIGMSDDGLRMLPMVSRRFAGTVDFSDIEPGDYVFSLQLQDDGVTVFDEQYGLIVETDTESGSVDVRLNIDGRD